MSTTPLPPSLSGLPPKPYLMARRSINATLSGPVSTSPADLTSCTLHPILCSWAQDQIAWVRAAHRTARIRGEQQECHYWRQRASVGLHWQVLPTPLLSLSGGVLMTITTTPTFGVANVGNPWGPVAVTPCQCSCMLTQLTLPGSSGQPTNNDISILTPIPG